MGAKEGFDGSFQFIYQHATGHRWPRRWYRLYYVVAEDRDLERWNETGVNEGDDVHTASELGWALGGKVMERENSNNLFSIMRYFYNVKYDFQARFYASFEYSLG